MGQKTRPMTNESQIKRHTAIASLASVFACDDVYHATHDPPKRPTAYRLPSWDTALNRDGYILVALSFTPTKQSPAREAAPSTTLYEKRHGRDMLHERPAGKRENVDQVCSQERHGRDVLTPHVDMNSKGRERLLEKDVRPREVCHERHEECVEHTDTIMVTRAAWPRCLQVPSDTIC